MGCEIRSLRTFPSPAILFCLLAGVVPSHDELFYEVRNADLVVTGVVQNAQNVVLGGHAYRNFDFLITKCWKGCARNGDVIQFRLPGGQLPNDVIEVSSETPEVGPGDHIVGFFHAGGWWKGFWGLGRSPGGVYLEHGRAFRYFTHPGWYRGHRPKGEPASHYFRRLDATVDSSRGGLNPPHVAIVCRVLRDDGHPLVNAIAHLDETEQLVTNDAGCFRIPDASIGCHRLRIKDGKLRSTVFVVPSQDRVDTVWVVVPSR